MKKDCDTIRPLIEGFANGTIASNDQQEVERHIDHCTACAREVKAAVLMEVGLRSMETLSCPEHVMDAVFDKAGISKRGIILRFPRFMESTPVRLSTIGGLAAAALAIVVLLSPLVGLRQPGSDALDSDSIAHTQAIAKWSMVYLAQTVHRSEKRILNEIAVESAAPKVRGILQEELSFLKGESS